MLRGAGYRLPSKAYVGRVSDSVDRTTYTFTGAGLGTADPTRVVVLCIYKGSNNFTQVSSVTCGGVSCTLVPNTNEDDYGDVIMAYVSLPTGTTGDIVVTFSGGAVRCSVDIYNLFNLNSPTPLDGDSNGTGANLTLTTQADGLVICTASMNTTGSRTFGGTGVTTDVNATVETAHQSSGSAISTTTSLTLTTTVTQDFAAGSWR
jgi:hypothetical protein